MKGWQGPTPERLALAERVRVLRDQGETHRAIAALLGISRSYASQLDIDPDGEKARARKDGYAGTCIDCGAATCGSDGPGKAPERCADCAPAAATVWSRELIVTRIREYAARYGHPPRAMDWNPALARHHGFDDASARFYADGCWPVTETVRFYFGSFNAGIQAAGFTPRTASRPRAGEAVSPHKEKESSGA